MIKHIDSRQQLFSQGSELRTKIEDYLVSRIIDKIDKLNKSYQDLVLNSVCEKLNSANYPSSGSIYDILKELFKITNIFIFLKDANHKLFYHDLVKFNQFGDFSYSSPLHMRLAKVGNVFFTLSPDFTNLEIGGISLKEIPSDVFSFKNLRSLSIVRAQLKSISPQIRNLTNLEFLCLNDNEIQILPSEIG